MLWRMDELEVVLPGDRVSLQSANVGPGLHVSEEDPTSALVTVAGLLKVTHPQEEGSKQKSRTWVDYSAKRVMKKFRM